jgi:predicted nucleic acid-binding protein
MERGRDYWDSCIFIDLLQQTAGRYDACEEIRKKAEDGELIIVTSAIALAEVCKLPASGLADQEQFQKITDFFENPYIAIRAVDRIIGSRARELTHTHGLPYV